MKQRIFRLVPLLILALLLAIRVADPAPLRQMRIFVFDSYQRLKPRQVDIARSPVRILDIDEESLARLGQWPWPRTVMVKLVERLHAMGAVVIAFDILLAEPDRRHAVTPDVQIHVAQRAAPRIYAAVSGQCRDRRDIWKPCRKADMLRSAVAGGGDHLASPCHSSANFANDT